MKSEKQDEWVTKRIEHIRQEIKEDARQKEKDFAQLKAFMEKKNEARKQPTQFAGRRPCYA